MRNHVSLYINGQRHRVFGANVFLSLSDYLRQRLRMCGTKIVCSEGDCGACSVLVGRAVDGRMKYQTVDSCIQFMFQLEATHVVTVEGLRENGQLNAVQAAMVRCHGSQCGFCTPGFVVAMSGMCDAGKQCDESDFRYGLTGNLCRCTGYASIIEAGIEASAVEHKSLDEMYPPADMLNEFASEIDINIEVVCRGPAPKRFFSPTSINGAITVLVNYPDAKLVAGATDVGVQINKRMIAPNVVVDLNRLRDLEGAEIVDGTIVAGARASWTEIEGLVRDEVPEFHRILTLFGAPQIRNVGTIGGNIANGSPIADSLPFLFVMEAEVELQGPDGTRSVNLNDFYLGYKHMDMRPGELITRVRIPLPAEDDLLRLYKVSRRRDLDIASFTAAILMRIDGETIESASVAYGAVGPTVLRARKTEAFLVGQPFTNETMQSAANVAVGEITPISDVRGKEDYRLQLARNVLLKFYHENQLEPV